MTGAPVRGLGVMDATCIITGSILGAAIFLVGGMVAENVASPLALLAVWMVGGVLALAGGLSNAELGAMFPRGGGEYIYLREAYGSGLAFLSGWTALLVGFPGSIATMAAGLGRTVAALTGFQARGLAVCVAIAAVVTLTAVDMLGLRQGKLTQNVLSIIEILAFGALIVAGLLADVPAAVQAAPAVDASVPRGGFGLALIPVTFAYCGWNAANYVAGEIRNPERTLARAVLIGTAICIVIYLLLNVVYLRVLPLHEMRGSPDVAQLVAERLFPRTGAVALMVVIAIAIVSSLQATIVVGPRLFHAMAADGLFFAPLARLHPQSHMPRTALLVQAALACVLLLSGSFERLLTFTTVAIVVFSTLTVAAVIVLRMRRPRASRPYRVRLFPVTPVVFVTANVWVLVNLVAHGVREAIVGLCIVAAGAPVYLWFRRRGGGSMQQDTRSGPESRRT